MKLQEETYSDLLERLYPSLFLENNFDKQNNIIRIPTITFQVTDDCNLKCSYCYQINKGHHTMPLNIAQKFIDLLLENNKSTQQYLDTRKCIGVVLDFIGGEPFLQIDLIDNIIEYFIKRVIEEDHPWQYNWKVSISSNGTLYFQENVQRFLKKWDDKISLGISVDGNKELHDSCRIFPDGTGSYDLAIAAVHDMMKKNKYVGSKVTISPENIIYLYDATISLIQEGYTIIHMNCIFEKGWTTDHAKILYKQLCLIANYLINNNLEDKIYISIFDDNIACPLPIEETGNWCGGNGQMIALDWKGDIYPCIRYMESSLGNNIEPIIIGNINGGIMTNAKCRNCINQLKQVNRISQSTEECINCPIATGCAWCQAYNYQDSGDFNHRATYICIMHKARALANVYYWNLLYWKKKELIRFKLWLPDEDCLQIISNEELLRLKGLAYPYIRDIDEYEILFKNIITKKNTRDIY